MLINTHTADALLLSSALCRLFEVEDLKSTLLKNFKTLSFRGFLKSAQFGVTNCHQEGGRGEEEGEGRPTRRLEKGGRRNRGEPEFGLGGADRQTTLV